MDSESDRTVTTSQYRKDNPNFKTFPDIETFKKELISALKKYNYNIKEPEKDKIQFIKPLGEGQFGVVHLATMGNDEEKVAIKLISKVSTDTNTIEAILMEILTITKVAHDNVNKFYGAYLNDEKNEVGLIFAFIDGVTLEDYVMKKIGETKHGDKFELLRTPLEITRLLIQFAQAIEVLHKENVIHRDIKPKNTMVTKEGKVILVDFGIARINDSSVCVTENLKFSPSYGPPEAVVDESRDPEKVSYKVGTKFDIWSFGCVIYFMFSGKKPWGGKTSEQIILTAKKGASEKVIPKSFKDPEIMKVLEGCIQYEVKDRITATEVIERLKELEKYYESQK